MRVSVLGGVQPGKLAEYVRGALRGGLADDGLMQRFQLAVYPDRPATWRYTDRPVDPEAERSAWQILRRLRNLVPTDVGAESVDWCELPLLRFSDDAQELLIEWLESFMPGLRRGDEPSWLESHFVKYQSLVGRLALVQHLANGQTGAVKRDTLATAIDWIPYLQGHARRLYAPATDNGLTAAHLIEKRRGDLPDGFTARDIHRKGWSGLADRDTIGEALEVLVDYRHLVELPVLPGTTGGRPSTRYTWQES